VYVFRRIAGAWIQDQVLLPWGNGHAVGWQFGFSVAIDGDVIVIGAPGDSTRGPNAGAVYVFRHNGTSWAPEAKVLPGSSAAGDTFGMDVGVSGERMIVGAPLADDLAPNAGSAIVLHRVGLTWLPEATLLPSDGVVDDRAGIAVAIDGDAALVGSIQHDFAGDDAGAAWLWQFDGEQWHDVLKLTAPDAAADDAFGFCVDVSPGAIAVGAYGHDGNGINNGMVYAYPRQGDLLLTPVKLQTPGDGVLDQLGVSLALDDGALIAAAPGGTALEAYVYDDVGAIDSDGNGVPDECESVPGDINGDGLVDGGDLLALFAAWGRCPSPPALCPADLTEDGIVNEADLALLYEYW
jgi:hypothetical protein